MDAAPAAPTCDLRCGADFGRPFASTLDPPLNTATCNGNYPDWDHRLNGVGFGRPSVFPFLGAFRLRAIFLQEVLLRRTGCRGLQNMFIIHTPHPLHVPSARCRLQEGGRAVYVLGRPGSPPPPIP